MKALKHLAIAGLLLAAAPAQAQTELTKYVPGITTEGAVYFLPKTELRFVVQIERTVETPGDFRAYANRYLRLKDVIQETHTNHKVNSIRMYTVGTADKSKGYAVKFHAKSSATNMQLSAEGVLMAINDKTTIPAEEPLFTPAPKVEKPNPRNYLSQEILAAGSTAKMAELIAREIYTIRESKNELTRGEADYMPKDGEQLKLMLQKLDEQDKALSSMFCGTTEKDTFEVMLTVCPDSELDRQVLFRLSQKMGLVDADDLSGEPFYISVKDLHSLPPVQEAPATTKKKKAYDSGIYVNVPGKALVSVCRGNDEILSQEINTAQFGRTELLGGELFNKKYITKLLINPITGAVDKFESVDLTAK